MEKETKIQIVKYLLVAAVIASGLYDFYLFYKYDRFHAPNPRAWPCINVTTIRLQLLVSTILIIRYLTLNKIRLYDFSMLIAAFVCVLYVQNLIFLNRFRHSITCESHDTISNILKLVALPLLMIYIFLIKNKRLGGS